MTQPVPATLNPTNTRRANQFFELLGGPAPALDDAQQPAEGPPLAAAGPLKQFLGPAHRSHGAHG